MIDESITKEAEIVRAKNKTLVFVKKLGGLKLGRSGLEGGNGLEGMVGVGEVGSASGSAGFVVWLQK